MSPPATCIRVRRKRSWNCSANLISRERRSSKLLTRKRTPPTEHARFNCGMDGWSGIRRIRPWTTRRRSARRESSWVRMVDGCVLDFDSEAIMSGFWQDVRFAVRVLGKNIGVTALMVFTLALAIGTTTAIFSVVYGVLLRPLPYSGADRIMAVSEVNLNGTSSRLADPNFDDFRDQNHSFQSIAKYSAYPVSVSGAAQPTRTTVASVTPQFLSVFRVEPIIGRDFTADDNRKGAAPVAIVSYGYWTQNLGSAQDLSQAHLKINNAMHSVIGVLPAGFRFPDDADVWAAADVEGENPSRTSHNYSGVGRLRDGVSVAQAREDISAIARRIYQTNDKSDYLLRDGAVVSLQDSITGTVQRPLLILLGAVGFLLLVACANVANLLLAQASVRERELAIRGALGAGRGRLVRQFLTEAFLLSLIGGVLGVLAAIWGVAGLVAVAPDSLPRLDSVSVNVPVLLFALTLCFAMAASLGAFTAARATRGDVRNGLAEGGRGQAGSQGGQRVGRALVAAQIAITLVLVVAAGLLGRSLMKVLDVDPGFRVDKIVAMDVSLPWVDDPKAKAAHGVFFSNLMDRLKQIPGVRGVGAVIALPMTGGLPDGMFVLMTEKEVPKTMEGFAALFNVGVPPKERIGTADFCVSTEGYFRVLGIPVIRGRML